MDVIDRPVEEKSRGSIEQKLEGMGEYVKMSYLQRALKSGLDFDTKKFVLLRLGGIYEVKGMYMEAAKLVKVAAEINTTFKDKIRDYMKSIELHIKAGSYQEADMVFRQANALGTDIQKLEMKNKMKEYYLTQARILLNNDKRSQAKKIYEKLMSSDLNFEEKEKIKSSLLDLYDKLGDVRAYFKLKDSN